MLTMQMTQIMQMVQITQSIPSSTKKPVSDGRFVDLEDSEDKPFNFERFNPGNYKATTRKEYIHETVDPYIVYHTSCP